MDQVKPILLTHEQQRFVNDMARVPGGWTRDGWARRLRTLAATVVSNDQGPLIAMAADRVEAECNSERATA